MHKTCKNLFFQTERNKAEKQLQVFIFITYYFMSCCQKLKQSTEIDQTIDSPKYHKKKEIRQSRKMNSLTKKEYGYFRRKKTVLHRKSEIEKTLYDL